MDTNNQDQRKTILCVDDEPNILSSLQRTLHSKPYRILTASCGKEAIKLALEERPDIIFMDVNMPQMDGYACLAELRREGLETPVVMLTGDENIIKGYVEGASYFIPKPFRNEHVLNIVEYIIDEPSEERKAWLELRI